MKLGQRIAFRQAKIILFTSFLIGGISALLQFYSDLINVRENLHDSIERSVSLYTPNLQRSIYNLDVVQVQNISELILADPLFASVQVFDDFGDQIGSTLQLAPVQSNWLTNISFHLLGLPLEMARTIVIPSSRERDAKLVLKMDKHYVASGLTSRAITLALTGLISTLLLSCILFIVFYFALSRPIQEIAKWVAHLDQDNKQQAAISPYTKADELGELVQSVEQIWHKKDLANRQIKTLAYYDTLTDLANRRMFIERLEEQLELTSQHPLVGAVMYLDIDRFKTINDSLGHQVGDQLLITFAQRLKGCLPDGAVTARFGGDEFVILLPAHYKNEQSAATCVQNIARQVNQLVSAPVQIGRHLIHCTTSIGLTIFPQSNDTSSQILRRADTALYRTKAEGRNGFRFFDVSMQRLAQSRWQLEEGLHQAIHRGELELWFQPQVTKEGVMSGAEVLLRWRHPTRGLISPLDFISVAEESGQIAAIEEWVLDETMRLIKHWDSMGLPETFRHVSINISPSHFMQSGFVSQVEGALERHTVANVNIELEITENLLIENFELAIKTMKALQAKGIAFSIDDFGTGYSSLRYLSQLPLNVLKIDRSFVAPIDHESDETPIIDVIMLMAKKLGLEVIAEGVETQAQRTLLTERGCRLYQGYFFSKPLHHEEFYTLLKQERVLLPT